MTWVGLQFGWGSSQRIIREGWTVITRLEETEIWCLLACSVWWGISESILFGRKLLPQSQTIQFLSIHLWSLFSCCPSTAAQGESIWICPCAGPLWGTAWDSSSFCLPQPQFLSCFIAKSYRDFSFWSWNPGLGTWIGAGTPHSSGVSSKAKISLSFTNNHMWVWDQFVLHLCASYQSQCGFSCISLVVGLQFI